MGATHSTQLTRLFFPHIDPTHIDPTHKALISSVIFEMAGSFAPFGLSWAMLGRFLEFLFACRLSPQQLVSNSQKWAAADVFTTLELSGPLSLGLERPRHLHHPGSLRPAFFRAWPNPCFLWAPKSCPPCPSCPSRPTSSPPWSSPAPAPWGFSAQFGLSWAMLNRFLSQEGPRKSQNGPREAPNGPKNGPKWPPKLPPRGQMFAKIACKKTASNSRKAASKVGS